MSGTTAISWTDATWNPLRGCSRVSEGCRHCYAEVVAARFSGPGQPYEGLAKRVGGEARWTGTVRFIEKHLADPLHWRTPRRIFVNSMSDLFHETVETEWLDRIFAVMVLAPQHTFQVLTKRPARMREYLTRVGPDTTLDGGDTARWRSSLEALRLALDLTCAGNRNWLVDGRKVGDYGWVDWPPPNVHLGVSVENQATADERIPLLLDTPAAVRWISAEPLLGPVVFPRRLASNGVECWDSGRSGLDWVVVGGESGPGHRPMEIDWLAQIVQQCRAAHVPVWVKQDSGAKPGRQGRIPAHLWVQERPEAMAR